MRQANSFSQASLNTACSSQSRELELRKWTPVIGGFVAQLVEQLTLNQRVGGSIPPGPTNRIKDLDTSLGILLVGKLPRRW
jgi:hypothetical protein